MKIKFFLQELKHHAPFTFFATVIAIFISLIFVYLIKINISSNVFEVFHILHLFVSAMVTSAIYYKYKPKIIYALLIGITGAIIIGSISDIIFPWIGGSLLGLHMHFHLPLLEIPLFVIITATIGSLLGIKTRVTRMPHFIHVFLSVFASLFYILAFSSSFQMIYFMTSIFIVFVAVVVPCCISDILYPHLFLGNKIKIRNKIKIKNKK